MKKLGFLLLFAASSVFAEMTAPPTNSVWTTFNSSYFTLGVIPRYVNSGRALYWWDRKLQQWSPNRSGDSLLGAVQRHEKYGLQPWSHVGAGANIYDEYWADNNNGSYTTATWGSDFTNFIAAPGLLWNGTVMTNEGGVAATLPAFKYITGGTIPTGPNSSLHFVTGGPDELRNNWATNYGWQLTYLTFDNFHWLNFNANWTNDILNETHYREVTKNIAQDDEHPGTSGAMAMADNALSQQINTNIWTASVSATGTINSTNRCVVTSAILSGSTLTVNITPLAHSYAPDFPDATVGKTNDCTDGLILQPALSNAFYEVFRIPDAPDGNVQVNEDGSNILTTTGATLRGGLNFFLVTKGAMWDQRRKVGDLYSVRYGYDPNTYVVSNGGTATNEQSFQSQADGAWTSGKRGDALITALDATVAWTNIHTIDTQIWTAATPTNHVLTFTFASSPSSSFVPAPFRK